jgi:hypothetical protein
MYRSVIALAFGVALTRFQPQSAKCHIAGRRVPSRIARLAFGVALTQGQTRGGAGRDRFSHLRLVGRAAYRGITGVIMVAE